MKALDRYTKYNQKHIVHHALKASVKAVLPIALNELCAEWMPCSNKAFSTNHAAPKLKQSTETYA